LKRSAEVPRKFEEVTLTATPTATASSSPNAKTDAYPENNANTKISSYSAASPVSIKKLARHIPCCFIDAEQHQSITVSVTAQDSRLDFSVWK
jgi:hypothetical protein